MTSPSSIKELVHVIINAVPRLQASVLGNEWPPHPHHAHTENDHDDHLHYMLCTAGIDRQFIGDVYMDTGFDIRATDDLRLDDEFRSMFTTAEPTKWTQDHIKLSASQEEWSDFYDIFGIRSIIGALNFVYNSIGDIYTAGVGIDISEENVVSLDHLGLEDLTNPGADRILFWDNSVTAAKWLTVGTNLSITGTTLNAAGSAGIGGGLDDAYRYDLPGSNVIYPDSVPVVIQPDEDINGLAISQTEANNTAALLYLNNASTASMDSPTIWFDGSVGEGNNSFGHLLWTNDSMSFGSTYATDAVHAFLQLYRTATAPALIQHGKLMAAAGAEMEVFGYIDVTAWDDLATGAAVNIASTGLVSVRSDSSFDALAGATIYVSGFLCESGEISFTDTYFLNNASWTSDYIPLANSDAEVSAYYALLGDTEGSLIAGFLAAASTGGGGLDAAYRFNFSAPDYSNKIVVDNYPVWFDISEDLNGLAIDQRNAANTEALFLVQNDSLDESGAQTFFLYGDTGTLDNFGHRFGWTADALSVGVGVPGSTPIGMFNAYFLSTSCLDENSNVRMYVENVAQDVLGWIKLAGYNASSSIDMFATDSITINNDVGAGLAFSVFGGITLASANGYGISVSPDTYVNFNGKPIEFIGSAGFGTAAYDLGTVGTGSITADFTGTKNVIKVSLTADVTSFTFTTPQAGTYILRMYASSGDYDVSGFPSGLHWHGVDPDVDTVTIPSGTYGTLVLTHYGSDNYDATISIEGNV